MRGSPSIKSRVTISSSCFAIMWPICPGHRRRGNNLALTIPWPVIIGNCRQVGIEGLRQEGMAGRFQTVLRGMGLAGALFAGGCASVPSIETLTNMGPNGLTISPTFAYVRIARGINACWLAPGRPLSKTHRLFANAAPGSAGGQAEIILHERALDGKKGLKAFRVKISPVGGRTVVSPKNIRFDAARGQRMSDDVLRWVGGDPACEAGSSPWKPLPPRPEAEPDPRRVKAT